MQDYYRQRAREYEMIYHRPDAVRLAEQEALAGWIRASLAGLDVVEIATGTGWWTVQAAAVADHVTATDAVAETLEIARTKPFDPAKVTFDLADAYRLDGLGREFSGALACFWLSHVPRAALRDFVDGLHPSCIRVQWSAWPIIAWCQGSVASLSASPVKPTLISVDRWSMVGRNWC